MKSNLIKEIIKLEKNSNLIDLDKKDYMRYLLDSYIIISYREKKIMLGYLILKEEKNYVEIERIFVLKKYRRRGIGKTLMKRVFSRYRCNIVLKVRQNNYGAIKFYKKLGFGKSIKKGKISRKPAFLMKLDNKGE